MDTSTHAGQFDTYPPSLYFIGTTPMAFGFRMLDAIAELAVLASEAASHAKHVLGRAPVHHQSTGRMSRHTTGSPVKSSPVATEITARHLTLQRCIL